MEAGLHSFSISPKEMDRKNKCQRIMLLIGQLWAELMPIRILHLNLVLLSAEFKLYLIKEFQRLKDEENSSKKLEWNLQRTLSKINYRIHTDAIKEELVPPTLTSEQKNIIYASEADVLNMALFGQTAATWRTNNKTKDGNIRDHATLEQLVVLTNLESINSVLIRQTLPQPERLQKLNDIAISQMKSLLNSAGMRKLK